MNALARGRHAAGTRPRWAQGGCGPGVEFVDDAAVLSHRVEADVVSGAARIVERVSLDRHECGTHGHGEKPRDHELIFMVLRVLLLDWYSLQYFRWIVLSLDRYSALFERALAPCSASVSDPRQHCHTCCLRAGIWPTWARWHHEAARRLQPHQCGLIDASSR